MPIRVLQTLSGGQLGGTELMVAQLLERLDRVEFPTDVSLLDAAGPITDRFAQMGIAVHELYAERGYLTAAAAFRALLHAGAYDVVHLYGFRMSLLGRFVASRQRPRPVVIHGIRGLHVTEGTDVTSVRTRFALALERAASRWIDAYVANSFGAVEFLAARGLPRDRFHVIPNGIDTRLWHRIAPRGEDVPVVVSVANFRPVKRLLDLIDALGEMRRQGLVFRAVIIGDGPLRTQLEARIDEHELGSKVTMPGQLRPEQVRCVLSTATVFVLPSLWEGMPVSVMEAMAMSLPVVGTDVPGIRELVVADETGVLVPPCNPPALAHALRALLASPDRGAALGAAGRRRMVEHFDVAQMVAAHASLYRSLVACRNS